MRPIKSPPSLFTMNGFGAAVYGNRDADIETGTYVKTYCLCAVFVPVIALGAYRVADAPEGGWYFIGKEPLSRLAKTWNWAFLCILILLGTGIGVSSYRNSPEYLAKQELKQAQTQAKAGQHLQAALAFRRLADGSHFVDEARHGLKESAEMCLQSNSGETVAKALPLLTRVPGNPSAEVFKRGLGLVEKFRPADPESALAIARALKTVDAKSKEIPAMEIDLLKAIVAKTPDNVPRVVELAVVYENENQLAESIKLLTPVKTKLGDTEGARILGQHLLQQGDNEAAYGLLHPFVQSRLATLRRAEHTYTNIYAQAADRALGALRRNQAPTSWYQAYEKAGEAEKEAMVNTYIQEALERDPGFKRATAELAVANKIVPVTLDLGIVQVNRAQNLQDPAARKSELEAAEKTFLAIRGMAGETDEYRLFLGEVYYWLGKSKEGKKLYDELLASRKRAYSILMALANKLRMVGEDVQSRELSEEAFRTAKDNKQRYEAAAFRSLVMKDNDDRIAWLSKADPNDTKIQIDLNGARGFKALDEQKPDVAAQFLRKGIAGYEKLPKTSTTLNNAGLMYLQLYQATGDLKDNERGIRMLEEALALDQGDSVLLVNTMDVTLRHALAEVIGDRLHLAALSEQAGFSDLQFLYNNQQERDAIYARLRENPNFKKALSYIDRVLLLAPKRLETYQTALQVQAGLRDPSELQKLHQRFVAAAPDQRESEGNYADIYKGTRDKEYRERTERGLRRLQGLLDKPGVRDHAPTLNYVKLQICGYQQGLWTYGVEVDADKLVQSAAEVYQSQPCSSARSTLIGAYLFRAVNQLRTQNAELDDVLKRTRRRVSASYLVIWFLERGGTTADQLKAHPDVQKAIALLKESSQFFPGLQDANDWAMFRHLDPALANRIAESYRKNGAAQLVDGLNHLCAPLGMTTILDQYWTLKLLGEEQKAAALYQDAIKKGVPLPSI
jgi:hypothetical protein